MRTLKKVRALAATLLVGVMISGTASADPILCKTVTNNHMLVDSLIVSDCLDAGVGNLTGNEGNDLFLDGAGGAYDFISKDELLFTTNNNQTAAWGTFTFDGSLWDIYSDIAVAFKFGTCNNPDEWFVTRCNHCWPRATMTGRSSTCLERAAACPTSTSMEYWARAKFQSLARSHCWAWPWS